MRICYRQSKVSEDTQLRRTNLQQNTVVRAVIFDLDQTLLDREKSLLDFLNWQCEGMLKPYIDDQEEFISRFVELDANGKVWKDTVYATLIDEFQIEGWSFEELLSVYESCFSAFCVPKPSILDALAAISTRYELGLVSNGMSPFQERNFRGLGVESLFSSVIVSAAVNLRKPDSAIFHLACSELDVRPSEAFYVGDNPVADIEGARDAGLRTIFIPSSIHPHCAIADASCEDMRQLPRIIDEIGEQD